MSAYTAAVQAAFLDELGKIAASKQVMDRPQQRSGRRPLSVDTLLKRDKEGKLFSKDKLGGVDPGKASDVPSRDGGGAGIGEIAKREDGHNFPYMVEGGSTVFAADAGPMTRP
jgi:hypothetical protein